LLTPAPRACDTAPTSPTPSPPVIACIKNFLLSSDINRYQNVSNDLPGSTGYLKFAQAQNGDQCSMTYPIEPVQSRAWTFRTKREAIAWARWHSK